MQFDTIPVSKERYETLSVPAQKLVVQRHQSRGFGAAIQAAAAGARRARPGARGKADRAVRAVHPAQRTGLRGRQRADCSRPRSARGERAQFSYEPRAHRLVGLLDQHPRSGAAQVVLPADRRARRSNRASGANFICPTPPATETARPRRRRQFRRPSHMAIFLTGATGYIGSYLAAGFLEQHGEPLNVLVRANDAGRSAAAALARAAIAHGFPRLSRASRQRASASSAGDLTAPHFGLGADEYRALVAAPIPSCTAPLR